jgi:hypothetical protein
VNVSFSLWNGRPEKFLLRPDLMLLGAGALSIVVFIYENTASLKFLHFLFIVTCSNIALY